MCHFEADGFERQNRCYITVIIITWRSTLKIELKRNGEIGLGDGEDIQRGVGSVRHGRIFDFSWIREWEVFMSGRYYLLFMVIYVGQNSQKKGLRVKTFKYGYFALTVKYAYHFLFFAINTHNSHFPGCTFSLASRRWTWKGASPLHFRCLSGVAATAAPDNQRNAGGAGPGLTTYRQPTIPFKVCFALTGACVAAVELRDVSLLVDRRRRPPPMYHTIHRMFLKVKGRSSVKYAYYFQIHVNTQNLLLIHVFHPTEEICVFLSEYAY